MVDQNFLVLIVEIHKAWNFADRNTCSLYYSYGFCLKNIRIVVNSLLHDFSPKKTKQCVYNCICCIMGLYQTRENFVLTRCQWKQLSHLYMSDWKNFPQTSFCFHVFWTLLLFWLSPYFQCLVLWGMLTFWSDLGQSTSECHICKSTHGQQKHSW